MKYEQYLRLVKNKKHRIMLSKCRLSSHDLEIERGRYDRKSTEPEQRHCKICQANKTQMMEDEFHFFMICSMYKTKRDTMLNSIYASFPNGKCLNLKDQFIWLMSQEDEICLKEIARFVSHYMELRDKELDKLLCINGS